MAASAATMAIGLSPESKRVEELNRHTMQLEAPNMLRHVFGSGPRIPALYQKPRNQAPKRGISYRERQRRGRKAAGR